MIAEPTGFTQLTKAEQIRYLMELWDRIVDSPGELPVSEAHLEIAAARLAAFRRDPTQARSAYHILDRLSEKAS